MAFKEGWIKAQLLHILILLLVLEENVTACLFFFVKRWKKNDLFDYNIGIYTAGQDFDEWRMANPESPIDWQTKANFHRIGIESEKRSNLEFLT